MASVRSKVKKTAATEPLDAIAELVERGISGTTNWYGDPYTEQNSNLTGASAYGVAGTKTWGEWEKIGKTDPDVASVLQFISSPIRSSTVSVTPAVHASLAESEAIRHADFVRDQLNSMEPSWQEVIAQGVEGALLSGFALHEVVLGLGEHPSLPGGEGYVLSRLAERLPSSVNVINGWREKILEDGGRELDYIQQTGQVGLSGFKTDIRLPADKILLWTWKRSGQNYRGVSAFRAVWYIAKIREQLLKLIGISLTREGAGIPVATADASADILTPSQQRKLERLLANLVAHENASVVMPRGWKMDWVFSGGGDKGHILYAYNGLGQLILRQLGAQQLSLGSGETGSRSVGEVHNSVAQGYLQGVLEMAHGVLNGCGQRRYVGLARKLIEPNFGPLPAYPVVKLTLTKASLSPAERVSAMAGAASAGLLTMTADDENQLRSELGMSPREIDEQEAGESVLNGAQVEAAAGIVASVASGALPRDSAIGMLSQFFGLTDEQAEEVIGSAGLNTSGTQPSEPGRDDEERETTERMTRRLGRTGAWSPWRELRPTEARMDLGRIDAFMRDQREDFQRSLRPMVVAMMVKAGPAITAAMADGDPSEVASMPLDTKAIDAAVASWLDGLRSRGARDVASELGVKPPPPAGEQSAVRAGALAARPAAVMAAQRKSIVRRIVGRVQGWLEREAMDTVRTGGSAEDVIAGVVAEQMDSESLRSDAGTAITRVYNVGRAEAAAELGATRAEYSAILDSGTCQQCLAMDGRVFDIDSDAYEQAMPPNRECDGLDNCRCVMAYIAGGG